MVLHKVKPERARLGELQVLAVADREAGPFHDSQPPAGLGSVAAEGRIEVVQRDARIVEAPVQPPPTRHLTRERHAQGDRRAPLARCVDPAVKVERVEQKPVGQVGSSAGSDADVGIPGDRRVARNGATLEAPHRNAFKAVFGAPSTDGPVVRPADAQVWHAHSRQTQVLTDGGIREGEERVGRELVCPELCGANQICGHVVGRLTRQ